MDIETRDSGKSTRDSNIELLRILAIMGVIILHYNNPLAGGGFTYSENYAINNFVLYWLESLVICAVDLFMLISGYYMCKSEYRNLWKPVELIIQLIIFQVVLCFCRVIQGSELSLKNLLGCFLPVNYFVILYCVVYCISPYVSFTMKKIRDRDLKKMMFMLFVFFSIYPTAVDVLETFSGRSFNGLNSIDMYGDNFGYTLVNFIFCWICGAYIQITNFKLNERKALGIYFAMTTIIFVSARCLLLLGYNYDLAFSYCNPLVVISAVMIFVYFKQINVKQSTFINNVCFWTVKISCKPHIYCI
jgi:surface polysaccharide O-acyltransferase-like enzyme